MIRCPQCDRTVVEPGNFCRFCGARLFRPERSGDGDFESSPPRPYSWLTDELPSDQLNPPETKNTSPVRPPAEMNPPRRNILPGPPVPQGRQGLQPQYQNTLSTGYRCPFCNSNALPEVVKKVSPAGWAVFAVLLVTTFIFFWIGLLIQEERRICPVCNMRVG